MKNKWFVALLMVVVMMCACWTGAVAENERKRSPLEIMSMRCWMMGR